MLGLTGIGHACFDVHQSCLAWCTNGGASFDGVVSFGPKLGPS